MYADSVARQRSNILDFLKHLVELESPSREKPHVNRVIDVLEKAWKELGFHTRRIEQMEFGDHLVAERNGDGPMVLMVGHADTVFPLGTIEKSPVRRQGDRLLGPGVLDMKGGLTSMLFGVRALLSGTSDWSGSIRVVVNSDEEPGSPTSGKWWHELVRGVDLALVMEPAKSDGRMVLNRKGVGIFHLEVNGRAAHAGAEPEKGASAIQALALKILDIQKLADPGLGTTVNIGVISGGTEPYIVPESACASLDIRIPSAAEKERVLKAMRKITAREDVPGAKAVLTGEFHRPPMEPTPGLEPFRILLEETARDLEMSLQWSPISGGASDGNNISALGVPTIDGFGPHGAGAHSGDEYLEIRSLIDKAALLAAFLSRLTERCSTRPEGGNTVRR